MVLEEGDKGTRRQIATVLAARLAVVVGRGLALIAKALGQAASQEPGGAFRILAVIAVAFAGQQSVQGVVDIVVPLGAVQGHLAALATLQMAGAVLVVLQ